MSDLASDVRLHVFRTAAESGRVPQPPAIAQALSIPQAEVDDALRTLAAGKVLILAPNSTNIWAANPFCAVPTQFRVTANGRKYFGICIWDALGIVAAVGANDAHIAATCGDCGAPIELNIRGGEIEASSAIIHFAIPAHHWWDNIGFT